MAGSIMGLLCQLVRRAQAAADLNFQREGRTIMNRNATFARTVIATGLVLASIGSHGTRSGKV
jgi:hypothetical protein